MSIGINFLSIVVIIIVVLIFFVLITLFILRRRNKKHCEQKQIYIGNLPYRINESDLRDFFSPFGHIQDIRVVRDRRTNRPKGYAFISYLHVREAKKSLSAHGKEFGGRILVVYLAKLRSFHLK